MDYDKKIGNYFLYLREKMNLSLEEVGSAIGMSASGYRAIETGKSSPRLAVLERLTDFYKIDMAELFSKINSGENLVPGPPEVIKCDEGVYRLIRDEAEVARLKEDVSVPRVELKMIDTSWLFIPK